MARRRVRMREVMASGAAAYSRSSTRPALPQPRAKLFGRHRTREQVALRQRTAERRQLVRLSFFLDAFGDHCHAEIAAELDHQFGDAAAAGGTGDLGNEGAVDLQLVRLQALQIAERGKTGAEVIDRDADAGLLDLAEQLP